jgi:hypothetical protein
MQETTVDGGFFCVLLEIMDVLVADVMGISVLQRRRGVAKEERCCKGEKMLQRKGVIKEESVTTEDSHLAETTGLSAICLGS